MNRHSSISAESAFTDRQAEVLEAALALLVAGGEKALTTAGIARAANCSKESLYKWFGDREGVLSSMVTHQASKVRVPAANAALTRSAETFRADFIAFGTDLLTVLSGETSLALNRLAIGQASREGSELGTLLIGRGRKAVRERAKTLLETARRAGHLRFDDPQRVFETLYGLIVADMHVRLLLGEDVPAVKSTDAMTAHVKAAIDQFYRLFGADQFN